MKYTALISLLTLLAVSVSVQAAGDPEAGKAKAQACFACHGVNGVSTNPVWPKLAGQGADYIAKQLADFKAGKRIAPLMQAQVASLSSQDMADLAAFFASQKPNIGAADKNLVKLGEKIYRGGNKETGVSACMACHSPTGSGNPPARFPRLGGQHAQYVVKALKDFRSGKRTNDPAKMMRMIAGHMSDAEIKAVASYVEGLH